MWMRRMLWFAVAIAVVAVAQDQLRVRIKEYEVPTRKSHPHDPAMAPDGSLWYTAQMMNKLGRLDPATGRFKEYELKTPESGPHGLVADKDGNIWFTANFKAYIGKLDPRTGEVTEYRASNADGIDPHTPVFDQDGQLWFTTERANLVGRLNPRTGAMSLAESPTRRALPYGIVVTKSGVPFFCEFGTNKLASVDPKTMEVREYELTKKDARPRRLALAPDGTIWYTDYARGYIGHFDPAQGKLLKEWQSPSGRSSRPYGIAVTGDGEVWYSESGPSPNTLVRFDPRTQKFSSAEIPSGGGVVRNMVATPDGRLFLACCGVNRVAVVETRQQTASAE